jgi:dihydroxy-acid dehydratase
MALNKRSQLDHHRASHAPPNPRDVAAPSGFGDNDFVKPIIGVANGHSNMNPCNAGIQPLVDRAMAALKEAGAMPQVFGVPTITDGIGMGTEAMKYSLVSREVIADAIETAVNGQAMDGVLAVGGCDKNMPGGMIAMVRMNVPGIYVYAGTIKPGKWKGQDLTIVSAFEAVGSFAAGKMSEEDFVGIEKNACPSVGACGGMFTANTMSSRSRRSDEPPRLFAARLARPGESGLRRRLRARAGRAVKQDLKPRAIVTRKSIENAVALIMATAARPTPCCTTSRSRMPRGSNGRSTTSSASARRCRCCAISSLRDATSRSIQSRRRRAAGAEDAPRARSPARRVHDDHRPHDGTGTEGHPGRAARDQGRDPAGKTRCTRRAHLAISKATSPPKAASRKSPGTSPRALPGPRKCLDSRTQCLKAIMA